MSATAVALLPNEAESRFGWTSFRERWDRLMSRCAGSECPRRHKFWPAWLRATSGVEFDGRWYCQAACLKPALGFRVHNTLSGFRLEKPRSFRLPLGLLLVERGIISQEQLRRTLQAQRNAGQGRLGDWLLDTGIITEPQLTAALGLQWGCPVFPLEDQPANAAWTNLLPLPLLESARVVPAYSSPDGHVLHLAFCDRVDHTTLYGIEQMLRCRTFACVSSKTAVTQALDYLRRNARRMETSFDTIRDSNEIVRTIFNYAVELEARRISIARAGTYLWVRFYRGKTARDLLFRILSGTSANHASLSSKTKVLSRSVDQGKDGAFGASVPV